MQFIRLFHTLKHLKLRQITGQLSRRILPFRHSASRVADFKAGAYPGVAWGIDTPLLPPPPGNNSEDRILAGKFEFLNESMNLGFPPRWSEGSRMKLLWEYNLHYFDWMHTLPFDQAAKAAVNWIDCHPPRNALQAWAPYPTSLRILNWIVFFFKNHQSETDSKVELRRRLWASIAQQSTYLKGNLETHLLGNHLFENLTTLVLVGACFNGPLAADCRLTAKQELPAQLVEQFLPDGLHFELSPMYHVRMVYLLYLIVSTQNPEFAEIVSVKLCRSLWALNSVRHPDGEIALLNDSAIGIYHNPAPLLEQASNALESTEYPLSSLQAPPGAWQLESGGYYGFRDRDQNYLICDAGSPGPDYIPGHAHADIFTYEVSMKGIRVIVDTGNHDYETGPIRGYCRSTRAHNTLELEECDQCDLWGSFRLGRRGHPADISFSGNETSFKLSGHHTGYAHADIKAVHERTFEVSKGFNIKISDRVTAPKPVRIKSYIHLAPDCKIARQAEQEIIVRYSKGEFSICFSANGKLEIQKTEYYPEFGIRRERDTLCYSTTSADCSNSYRITPC